MKKKKGPISVASLLKNSSEKQKKQGTTSQQKNYGADSAYDFVLGRYENIAKDSPPRRGYKQGTNRVQENESPIGVQKEYEKGTNKVQIEYKEGANRVRKEYEQGTDKARSAKGKNEGPKGYNEGTNRVQGRDSLRFRQSIQDQETGNQSPEPSQIKNIKKQASSKSTLKEIPDENSTQTTSPANLIKKIETKPGIENKRVSENRRTQGPVKKDKLSVSSVRSKKEITSVKDDSRDRVQSGYKKGTEGVRKGYEQGPNSVRIVYKKGTEQGTNSVQKEYIEGTEWGTNSLHKLSETERKFITFLFLECKKKGSLIGPPMKKATTMAVLGIASENTYKKVISRTIKKGFIRRHDGHRGNQGWTSFVLKQEIYQELILEEQSTNGVQKGYVGGTQWGTEQGTTSPSSSSINNKTTTNLNTDEAESNWSIVKIPKILRENNFTDSIILQVKEGNLLDPLLLQKSLDAFAFDIEVNNALIKRKIKDPIRFFMGILRKKTPYNPPSNYKTAEERFLDQIIEARKIENEKKEIQKTKLASLEFDKWMDSLTDEEKKSEKFLLPMFNFMDEFHIANMRNHFDKQIWPKLWGKYECEFLQITS